MFKFNVKSANRQIAEQIYEACLSKTDEQEVIEAIEKELNDRDVQKKLNTTTPFNNYPQTTFGITGSD